MFKQVYVIDIVALPKKWQRYFYDNEMYREYSNDSYINLCWDEFGFLTYESEGVTYETDQTPESVDFRTFMEENGFPKEAKEVLLNRWW